MKGVAANVLTDVGHWISEPFVSKAHGFKLSGLTLCNMRKTMCIGVPVAIGLVHVSCTLRVKLNCLAQVHNVLAPNLLVPTLDVRAVL